VTALSSIASLSAVAAAGVGLVLLTGARASASEPPRKADDTEARIAALVRTELVAMHSATTADLLPGALSRPLVAAGTLTLPYSEGRDRIVVVGLAPGPPGNLVVATQMESLRFLLRVERDGSLLVTGRPARADLVTAAARVLADEGHALVGARSALEAAGVPLPPGFSSWGGALRSITYDSRLPREQFVGDPSWSLIFEDWNEARGGWNMVLLDAGLGVTMVNGGAPGPRPSKE